MQPSHIIKQPSSHNAIARYSPAVLLIIPQIIFHDATTHLIPYCNGLTPIIHELKQLRVLERAVALRQLYCLLCGKVFPANVRGFVRFELM